MTEASNQATWDDFFSRFSDQYKTGLEIIEELERDGFKAGHMKSRMYEHLSQWQSEGRLEMRYRKLSERERKSRRFGAVKPGAEYRIAADS